MSNRLRERIVELAERQDAVQDRELRAHREEWNDPEPYGWLKGARDASRFWAGELRRVLAEVSLEERAAIRGVSTATEDPEWESLAVRQDGSGCHHYLAGSPVRPGDTLELLLPGGYALQGRYEWDTEGDRFDRAPVLVAEIPAGGALEDEAFISLPPSARVRRTDDG